ncbi:hypothetical protein [Streptomyces sp. NPDC048489]|uniref:hypothetical protein n=1 Tax=Streptomyces sp. NPDC048489 TaxID=3154504 RepID=UPI00343D77E2
MYMRSPLERLYRTKLTLFGTVLVAVGAALMVAGHWPSPPAWFSYVPILEAGSTVLIAGVFSVVLTYIDQQDNEARTTEHLRNVLEDGAPAMRDAVLDGFAAAPDTLTHLAPQQLDSIVENALAVRLGDTELAADAARDMREQIIGAKQRWYDAHVSIALAPWTDGPAEGPGSMFVATLNWQCCITPTTPVLRFSVTSDDETFRDDSSDPATTGAYFFQKRDYLSVSASSREAFQVLDASVNGEPLKLRRSERKDSQTYTANLGEHFESGKAVTLTYSIRLLVQQNGHMLHVDLAQPTKNFAAELWYQRECGIRKVNVVDYLSGPRESRITATAATEASPNVTVAQEGWTWPKAGVSFVWVLEREFKATKPQK